MAAEGLHHVGITVHDLEESTAFYRDGLGCALVREMSPGTSPGVRQLVGEPEADLVGVMLQTPGGDLVELVYFRSPREKSVETRSANPGTVHIALRVTSMEETVGRLRERGTSFLSDPVELSPGASFVYCRDPNGVLLELIQPAASPR